MKTSRMLKKYCSSLLAAAIILLIISILIPQQLALASTSITSTTTVPLHDPLHDAYGTIVNNFNRNVDVTSTHDSNKHWALLNVILCISNSLVAAIVVVHATSRKRFDDNDSFVVIDENDYIEKVKLNRLLIQILPSVLALFAIIIFIVTQDMTKPIFIVDIWTILHALILGFAIMTYFFITKKFDKYVDKTGK